MFGILCYTIFVKICIWVKIMDIIEKNGDLIISGLNSFSLEQIFECGQAFRWEKTAGNSYTGVAMGKALTLTEGAEDVTFHQTSRADFENIWFDYFDLSTNYAKIKAELSKDKILAEAIGYGEGIRILRQDLWECVVSFIISASNNIPRIKKIISTLCREFGTEISYMGKRFYAFPTAERLAALSLSELSVIKSGFRDKYILAAARAFASGEFDASAVKKLNTDAARRELKKLAGVGDKVADCVLLFGLSRTESFPVDVWVKRIMEYCYFEKPETKEKITELARASFGELGGFAQQYLFFWARENKIGV